MDIIALLSEKTVAIALATLVMWFYNRHVDDMLLERKVWNELVRAERKEWLDTADRYLLQVFELNKSSIIALTENKAEMHNLRGKLGELMTFLTTPGREGKEK